MKTKLPVGVCVLIALALVAFGLLYGTYAGYREDREQVNALLADSAAGDVQISMTNGKVTSNFHIVSYTVNGETTYTGIAQSGQRAAITSVDLSSVAVGTSVTVRLADGKDYTFTR